MRAEICAHLKVNDFFVINGFRLKNTGPLNAAVV